MGLKGFRWFIKEKNMSEQAPGATPEEIDEAQKFNRIVDERKLYPHEVANLSKDKTPEDVENEIALESEKIAGQKLEILMNPELQDFGVRFVNIEEYRKLLNRRWGKGRSQQVYMFGRTAGEFSPDRVSFRDYLDSSVKNGWDRVADSQTEWFFSTYNLTESKEIVGLMKESRDETKGKGREETIKKFREKFFKFVFEKKDSHGFSALANNLEEVIERYSKESNPFNRVWDSEKNIWVSISPEEAGEFFDLFYDSVEQKWERDYENPKNQDMPTTVRKGSLEARLELKDYQIFQKLKGSLVEQYIKGLFQFTSGNNSQASVRSAINALSYMEKDENVVGWNRQYHIVLVFSDRVLRDNQIEENPNWGNVNMEDPEGCLGAIAIMPNRELWQEMCEKSAQAGERAHPVFDSIGVVRYPKVKNEQTEEQQ